MANSVSEAGCSSTRPLRNYMVRRFCFCQMTLSAPENTHAFCHRPRGVALDIVTYRCRARSIQPKTLLRTNEAFSASAAG